MLPDENKAQLTPRLVDSLYTEAMLLADEARAYFDRHGREERESLDPLLRVGFSCESLKVTTRLMHVVAWLLTQRAVEAGEISRAHARKPARRLAGMGAADLARLDRALGEQPGDDMHQPGRNLQRFAGKADPQQRIERLALLAAMAIEIGARLVGEQHCLGIERIDQAGGQLGLVLVGKHERRFATARASPIRLIRVNRPGPGRQCLASPEHGAAVANAFSSGATPNDPEP